MECQDLEQLESLLEEAKTHNFSSRLLPNARGLKVKLTQRRDRVRRSSVSSTLTPPRLGTPTRMGSPRPIERSPSLVAATSEGETPAEDLNQSVDAISTPDLDVGDDVDPDEVEDEAKDLDESCGWPDGVLLLPQGSTITTVLTGVIPLASADESRSIDMRDGMSRWEVPPHWKPQMKQRFAELMVHCYPHPELKVAALGDGDAVFEDLGMIQPPAEGFIPAGYNGQLMMLGGNQPSKPNVLLVHCVFSWLCRQPSGVVVPQQFNQYFNQLHSGARDNLERITLQNTPFADRKSSYVCGFTIITPPDITSSILTPAQQLRCTRILSSCCNIDMPQRVGVFSSERASLHVSSDSSILYMRRNRRVPNAQQLSTTSSRDRTSSRSTLHRSASVAVPDFGITPELSVLPYLFSVVCAQRAVQQQYGSDLLKILHDPTLLPDTVSQIKLDFESVYSQFEAKFYCSSDIDSEFVDLMTAARAQEASTATQQIESLQRRAIAVAESNMQRISKQKKDCLVM
eukprot:TRINITY_DN6469_c0_g1_i9.p1 TRINITY_DN6469_c0_g1~~TRINITY_DN6469_c0_g1_i9.p1  ORF type:complete len:515 (-),score=196.64 TRINITY_DN6469_c0_g1_i9:267-1811(-)